MVNGRLANVDYERLVMVEVIMMMNTMSNIMSMILIVNYMSIVCVCVSTDEDWLGEWVGMNMEIIMMIIDDGRGWLGARVNNNWGSWL
jgi:hypothetical protein